jgi:hypothetical protein
VATVAGVSFKLSADSAAEATASHAGLWAGGVQVQQAPSIAKSRYRQQLEDAGRFGAGELSAKRGTGWRSGSFRADTAADSHALWLPCYNTVQAGQCTAFRTHMQLLAVACQFHGSCCSDAVLHPHYGACR